MMHSIAAQLADDLYEHERQAPAYASVRPQRQHPVLSGQARVMASEQQEGSIGFLPVFLPCKPGQTRSPALETHWPNYAQLIGTVIR